MEKKKKTKGQSPTDLMEVLKLLNDGNSNEDVAKLFEVNIQTVINWRYQLRKAGYAIRRKKKTIPLVGDMAKPIKRLRTVEWTSVDIADFMSDFLDINMKKTDKSIHEICNDLLLRMSASGIAPAEAEKMVLGVEWYLEDLIKRIKG